MKLTPLAAALISLALLVVANASWAYDHESGQTAEGSAKAAALDASASKSTIAAKAKAAAKIRTTDINSAHKDALKKLQGITDADADKIIANRPYSSKAWLITNKVLDDKTYDAIKGSIEARQPPKSAKPTATISKTQATNK